MTSLIARKKMLLSALVLTAAGVAYSHAALQPAGKLPAAGELGRPPGAYAGMSRAYKVDQTLSNVMFHVIKDDSVTVRGSMGVTGTMTREGKVMLEVNLASLDTKLEPRDINIKNTFFEIAKPGFGKAAAILQLDENALALLKKKEPFAHEVKGNLMLHGVEAPFTSKVFFSPGKNGGLRVLSAQPVEIHMDVWKLGANLDALMKVCGHKNVARPAQVTFDITLN